MREGPWTINVDVHSNAVGAATFTNMPAADTFMFNSHRHVTLINVEGMTQVRLKVNKQATAGASGAKLMVRFSRTFSTSVGAYTDVGVTEVSVPINAINTFLDSGHIDLNPDTHGGDIYVAIVGTGGNGTLDPQFGHISVSFS
jgi:hypothetical protein